jgi:hypothetical protein
VQFRTAMIGICDTWCKAMFGIANDMIDTRNDDMAYSFGTQERV